MIIMMMVMSVDGVRCYAMVKQCSPAVRGQWVVSGGT